MRHSTELLADAVNGMLSVRLDRTGKNVLFSLTTQAGVPVAGPCGSERELDSLCHRLLNIKQRKAELDATAFLARFLAATTAR
jgi:hypothetical protein